MANQTYQIPQRRRPKQSWLQRNALLIFCVTCLLVALLLGYLIGYVAGRGSVQKTAAPETAGQIDPAESTPPGKNETQKQTDEPETDEPETDAPETDKPETDAPETDAPATTKAPDTEHHVSGDGSRSIYLTFDDGPCQYTPQVLDILDQYNVKVTFFTVGYFVDSYPEYAAEIMRRGHLIACHSYTHEMDQCYASVDAFMNEVDRWKKAVQSAAGTLPDRICVRFPGGSTTGYASAVADGIKATLNQNGYQWFDWNAGNNDKWPNGNTENLSEPDYFMKSYRECINWFDEDPNATVVFLAHETEPATVQTLPQMLEDLLQRGYTFKTLDQHPKWG